MNAHPAAPQASETKTPAQDNAADPSASQAAPAPGASTTRPAPAARPAAATRGSGSGFGKFLPRAVRRSQLDREAIAQKETQKLEDKAAQDARMKRAARGRGGRRARGGPAGGFQDRVIRGGAGGFGSMIEATSSRECYESRCCTMQLNLLTTTRWRIERFRTTVRLRRWWRRRRRRLRWRWLVRRRQIRRRQRFQRRVEPANRQAHEHRQDRRVRCHRG